jgi:hypothetical protein
MKIKLSTEMKTTNLCLLLLVCCVAGCRNNSSAEELLVLDVERAIDNTQKFDLLEIVADCEFIALDAKHQEAILGEYLMVVESEEKFYIADYNREPLKVFSKTGEFLSTIGRIGRGPNEVPYIADFAVDDLSDNVYIKGETRILAYDANGNLFARRDSVASEGLVTVGKIKWHNGNLFLLAGSSSGEPPRDGKRTLFKMFSSDITPERGIDVFDKGSTEGVRLPITGGVLTLYPESGVVYDNGESLFVKEVLSDTVFMVGRDRRLVPAYRLDAGRYFLPAEAYTSLWDGDYFSISDIQAADRYIIMDIGIFAEEWNETDYLILDRENPAGGFTPMGLDGTPGLFFDGVRFEPSYVRDNRLVGYMQAIDIVDRAENLTNPDLKALATTLQEDSNPVLMIARFK